jgi:dihydroxyacid dehydratase/phosphogluconate dehydratase
VPTFDKSRLPSRHVSVGPERAPHRSYYYAMGLSEEEIARPFVAVASAGNDSAPCNTTLDMQADACRIGVEQGGGMPRRFNTITVTDGIAMGLSEEEISRPFVAVASAGNDSAPCNTTLDMQADACRIGVEQGGGMPRRFNTITVTDGIAMGHQGMKSSLVSREVIADSVELSVRGHCYDALVTFAGCDKSCPA